MTNKGTHKVLNGFTLMELLIAIVILGTLIAITLPRYDIFLMKMKNQEGIQVLLSVYRAERAYKLDHGTYTQYINDLDTQIPPMKNFYLANIGELFISCSNWPPNIFKNVLAEVQSVDTSSNCGSNIGYLLLVLPDAQFLCCSNCSAADDICTKMGFNPPTQSDPPY